MHFSVFWSESRRVTFRWLSSFQFAIRLRVCSPSSTAKVSVSCSYCPRYLHQLYWFAAKNWRACPACWRLPSEAARSIWGWTWGTSAALTLSCWQKCQQWCCFDASGPVCCRLFALNGSSTRLIVKFSECFDLARHHPPNFLLKMKQCLKLYSILYQAMSADFHSFDCQDLRSRYDPWLRRCFHDCSPDSKSALISFYLSKRWNSWRCAKDIVSRTVFMHFEPVVSTAMIVAVGSLSF